MVTLVKIKRKKHSVSIFWNNCENGQTLQVRKWHDTMHVMWIIFYLIFRTDNVWPFFTIVSKNADAILRDKYIQFRLFDLSNMQCNLQIYARPMPSKKWNSCLPWNDSRTLRFSYIKTLTAFFLNISRFSLQGLTNLISRKNLIFFFQSIRIYYHG